jgi:Helix-turn-helix domain
MRGRHPSGPEYVNYLEGSPRAKERLRVVLETMAGRYRVQEACELLGICEQRFDQLRQQALQAALGELESKPGGRPRRQPQAASEETRVLRQQVTDLEAELQAAHVREEIALILPRASDTEKKTIAKERK